jgi:hypothetical protein
MHPIARDLGGLAAFAEFGYVLAMRDGGEPGRQSAASDVPPLHAHVITSSPTVFVTLLSILVALDLSDLVTEARAHMQLWPLSILILCGTTLVGRPLFWPWLYASGVYLVTCSIAVVTMVHHLAAPGRGRPFAILLRPLGPFAILYFGAPLYLVSGWLDQQGRLSPALQLILAFNGGPASLVVVVLFLREWRATLEALTV